MATKSKKGGDPVSEELEQIKRLLILNLIKNGSTQSEIGGALGVDQSQVSRLVPTRALKPKKKR